MSEQPAPKPGQKLVLSRLMTRLDEDAYHLIGDDLIERAEVGLERYGMPLMTFNGRNALRDLYDEVIDAMFYLTQYGMERGEIGGGIPGYHNHWHRLVDIAVWAKGGLDE